jgi:hypothetical protein
MMSDLWRRDFWLSASLVDTSRFRLFMSSSWALDIKLTTVQAIYSAKKAKQNQQLLEQQAKISAYSAYMPRLHLKSSNIYVTVIVVWPNDFLFNA